MTGRQTYHPAKMERPSGPNRPEWEVVAWPLVAAAVPSCYFVAVVGAARAWIQHWEVPAVAAAAAAAGDYNGLAAAERQEAAAAA